MKAKFYLSLVALFIFIFGSAQRMMYFDSISEEHLIYDAEADELQTISKNNNKYVFSILEDMSKMFKQSALNSTIETFTIDNSEFDESEKMLTLYVKDKDGAESVFVINEKTMLLVESYSVNGRIELDRYELSFMGYRDEEETTK